MTFGNLFHSLILDYQSTPSPYYVQTVPEPDPDDVKVLKEDLQCDLGDIKTCFRENSVRNFIDCPPAVKIKEVLDEIIHDSLRETFKLGTYSKPFSSDNIIREQDGMKHSCGCKTRTPPPSTTFFEEYNVLV